MKHNSTCHESFPFRQMHNEIKAVSRWSSTETVANASLTEFLHFAIVLSLYYK